MRILLLLALLAAPASAQRLGERTTSPQSMVQSLDRGSPDDELREQVAAAERSPLGTVENPLRVGGPQGERAYLARLRCPDGSAPQIGARREAGVGAFGSVVGAYEVSCGVAASRLVFDMYHEEHVETRAPTGFVMSR
jgi:hypothetical protein